MAKTKGSSKKQQKRAIVLPEQSVASEKAGLAVDKKDLTLKELLQHTSHQNAIVRKEKLRERISDDDKTVRENLYQLLKSVILAGYKEDNQGPATSLMMAYIFNAMMHLAIDVRLMAFKFFDHAVQYHPPLFFSYAEKWNVNKGPNPDHNVVRNKTAMEGFSCGTILQNYKDILWKNQFYLEDKGKLKNTLAEYSVIIKKLKDIVPVLVSCFQDFLPILHDSLDAQSFDCMLNILRSTDIGVSFFIHGVLQGHPKSQPLDQSFSSVLLKKLLVVFPLSPIHCILEKDDDKYVILNIVITEIFMHLSEWICPLADLLEEFLTFVEYMLLVKSCSCMRSGKAIREKQISTLIPFIPKHVSQAFTKTFQDCSPESSVKLACLAAIEEMIISREDLLCTDVSDSELFDYQITWIRELPTLLVVLHLLLRLGQCSLLYDEMQCLLKEFYSTYQDEGNICYGPFLRLDRDSQELSICCLDYFSQLDSTLLKSIASCCLCHELDPFMLFWIIEVLHSAFKAGHVQISDHISFFITLVSRFKENIFPAIENNMETSNRGTFKSLTNIVCSCLSQMGDNSIVFAMPEKVILEQMSLEPPLDNCCAMLRMLIALDTKPTRLSERSICSLSNVLSAYLIDVAHCVPEDVDESTGSLHEQTVKVKQPMSDVLKNKSEVKLQRNALSVLEHPTGNEVDDDNDFDTSSGSDIGEHDFYKGSDSSLLPGYHIRYAKGNSSRIKAIVSVLLWMQRDAKVQQILYSYKEEIDHISRSICSLQIDQQRKEKSASFEG
ncbi:uncharacterized protein LOC133688459 [Populus nigra]|uniref:uncharacterized protein LOC133688459 n=1 Tax=Populus nigra TaxID=3691 RepID=UPI002B27A592|nr:uncharacterized protein LOC133688459 [Populus nigra]